MSQTHIETPSNVGVLNIRARPLPHRAISTYPIDDELVIFDPRSGEAHVLNRTGAFVWSLCDGKRDVNAIAAEVADAYRLDDALARTDTEELLVSLVGAGLIAVD